MKFKYVGPLDSVDVPELGVTVERGHQVEATGAVAESLDAQADWQRADKPKPRKAAATKSTSNPDAGTPADQNEE